MGTCCFFRSEGREYGRGHGHGHGHNGFHHKNHHGHHLWRAAPNCTEDHNYTYSTDIEGEKEGEGDFRCVICSSIVQVRLGRYHCSECDIDVCKTCFEEGSDQVSKGNEEIVAKTEVKAS